MKEINILAGIAVNNFLILFNIKGQYMRESNILAENATIKLPQRQIWLDTEEEYMKESNIPAGNTENSFQERERLLDIIGMLIKANNHKTQLLTCLGELCGAQIGGELYKAPFKFQNVTIVCSKIKLKFILWYFLMQFCVCPMGSTIILTFSNYS